ncbi:MAG: hypothetical protein L6V93_18140 [Clostridiales bacterium]|nr:MAG: hypothetical protein L6V93_18140 [Clostridiales bacterium]
MSVLLTVTVYAASDYTVNVTDGTDALYSSFITRQKVVDLLENNLSVRKTDKSFTDARSFALGKTKRVIVDDGENLKELYTEATYVQELIDEKCHQAYKRFRLFLNVASDALITNDLKN